METAWKKREGIIREVDSNPSERSEPCSTCTTCAVIIGMDGASSCLDGSRRELGFLRAAASVAAESSRCAASGHSFQTRSLSVLIRIESERGSFSLSG